MICLFIWSSAVGAYVPVPCTFYKLFYFFNSPEIIRTAVIIMDHLFTISHQFWSGLHFRITESNHIKYFKFMGDPKELLYHGLYISHMGYGHPLGTNTKSGCSKMHIHESVRESRIVYHFSAAVILSDKHGKTVIGSGITQ